jgi:hypothetical protein
MTQGFKVTTSPATTVQAVWEEVVDQVRDQGLDLAIRLAEPKLLVRDPANRRSPATVAVGDCAGTVPARTDCLPATPAKAPCSAPPC